MTYKPTYCKGCGEKLDKNCMGLPYCPSCDGPCPYCSDGDGYPEDEEDSFEEEEEEE